MAPEPSSSAKPLPKIFFITAGVIVLTFLLDFFFVPSDVASLPLRALSLLIDIGVIIGLIGLRISHADSFRFSHIDGGRNNAVFWVALVVGIAPAVMRLIGWI